MRARLPLLLAMAALLLLALLAARGGSAVPSGHGVLFGARGTPQADPNIGRRAPQITGPLGMVLGTATGVLIVVALVLFLGVVVIAGVALASIRWHRRRRLATGPGVLTEEQEDGAPGVAASVMAQEARGALVLLRQRIGGPPADAVQEAWLVLESAAARSGARRRPEQTPTEFTTALLAEHAVDPAAVATLRGLYQRARFGAADSVTAADAAAAVDALDRIAADLDAPRATTSPARTAAANTGGGR